jgi:parallel beta-helix repeat protein
MVSGTTWPHGDPFLQRQNEPSIAVSTRNSLHLLAGANDYRTVDLPGLPSDRMTGDAWLGVFTSYNGGATWRSTLVPGYLQDPDHTPPLWGFDAGADPTVRSGPYGLFFYSGIAFDRTIPEVTGRVKRPEREHLAGADGATSAVFVARYIDNNNKENGEPIAHLDTKVVARGTGTFVDKPWLAVDMPRKKPGVCTITQDGVATQSLTAFNVYVAYSAFTGEGSTRKGEIFFTGSSDCGANWTTPKKISGAYKLSQGAVVALDPRAGTVYVSWRRFASGNETNAVLITRSLDGGKTFTAPEVVANINPFDQGTSETRFRTNSYPTMTLDRKGNVFIAWSEHGVEQGVDSRIVWSRARYKPRERVQFLGEDDDDGTEVASSTDPKPTWSAPVPVDNHSGRGHQLMPSMILTAGKLQIGFIDLRDDHSWSEFTRVDGGWLETRLESYERTNTDHVFNNQQVDDRDVDTRRHTIDVWVAQAPAGDSPVFVSRRVSAYAAGSRPDSTKVEQLQFNPPNLPLFRQGTGAFAGDYVDVAALAYEPKGPTKWKQAKKETTGGTTFITFTDNRDVRPPSDGRWDLYTPPIFPAFNPDGTFEPGNRPNACEPEHAEHAGMRNQNIYLARVTQGLFVGAPGDAKPLGRFQRAFAVFVQNDTRVEKIFRLSIPAQPAGGIASFLQFSKLTQLDATIGPRSSISRTVFVTSTDPKATVRVDVQEIAGGKIVPVSSGGLQDSVLLNPDIVNPDIVNPDIVNPNMTNTSIIAAEVYNPDIVNPDIVNPDIVNPDIVNPDIVNPDIVNPDIVNPDIVNPDIVNPDIVNPDIVNPDIVNPDIVNPDIVNLDLTNATISDIIWNMTNNGNTTTAYDVDLLLRTGKQLPADLKTQLILHKTYTTPIAKECQLMEQTQNVIMSNVPSPLIIPAASYPGIDLTNGSVKNATLWLAPGESAKITLRVVDPDGKSAATSRTARALSNAVTLQNGAAFDIVAAVAPVVMAQAVNTVDVAAGSTTPPSATTLASIFLQRPTDTPIGGLVSPPVSVLIQDDAGNAISGATVTLNLAVNPGGATPHGNTATTGPAGVATFPNLWFDRLGSNYRLVAVATLGSQTYTSETSAAFSVIPLVVTNTNDAGPGSLRQAILNAERNVGFADAIGFAIPGPGTHTIALASALPVITDPVTLDATTQPGYAGVPLIRLDGAGAGSANGLDVRASNSLIQGFMVTQFSGFGIRVTNATATSVAKNFVGTDGTSAPGNGQAGILVTNASSTQITGNLISGNHVNGITLDSGTTGAMITNNQIGTNAAGTTSVGNTGDGVGIYNGASGNTVSDNIICANTFNGVRLNNNATGNTIRHNWVGTNAALAAGLGNGHQGISVAASSATTIGGSTGLGNVVAGNGQGGIGLEAGATLTQILGNTVSGNSGPGIGVINSQNATITGNRIGTNPAGTAAWANTGDGISVSGATTSWTTIGGSTSGAGNLISGNTWNGIAIGGATLTMIWGNLIGTDAGGTLPIPNGRSGVTISASNNHIGDELPYPPDINGNVIAFNSTYGIEVVSGTRNDIVSNRIFANGSLGIYLGAGANDGLNAPVITSAFDNGTTMTVTGTVNVGDPTQQLWLDLFANAACDSSGYGEGQILLGHKILYPTDSDPFGVFSFTAVVQGGHGGQVVTATAQTMIGAWSGDTSPFSACVTVTASRVLWARQFGGAAYTTTYCMATDGSAVYLAGLTTGAFPGQTSSALQGSSDAYVRKVDLAGNEVWTRQFGIVSIYSPRGIAVDASGVYVAGYTAGALPGQSSSGGDDAFVRKYDLAGTELWTRQFGTAGGENVYAVVVDASGVYVAGYTGGTLPGQTSSGGYDAFVRKYDTSGNEVWTRQFGSGDMTEAYAISIDASGVYVAGYTYGALPGQTSSGGYDAFVRKYNTSGTELWTRQFGSNGSDFAYGAIAIDASGVYVSGTTSDVLPGQTSSGGTDAFVRKYDLAGTELWTRQFGTTTGDKAAAISADASGVYVAGYVGGALPGKTSSGGRDAFVRKYHPDGTELWTRQFGSADDETTHGVSVDASGVYVAGTTLGTLPGQTSCSGGYDGFIRKYDVTGSEVWTRQFGTTSDDVAQSISVDASGVYVAGETNGTLPGQTSAGGRDAFVCKYDLAGNELWTRQFGTAAIDFANGISSDASGVYVVGLTEGTLPGQTSSGAYDVFVRKYDPNGNEVWTRQFGTTTYDYPAGIAIDASGVYVAGHTGGTLPGQASSGSMDAFVRKYDLNGNEIWTRQFGTGVGENLRGISLDASAVYVAGLTSGTFPGQTSSGGLDVFVRKCDLNTGAEVWTRQFGTAFDDFPESISVDASGVYVAGVAEGSLSGQTYSGGWDAFVRKYDLAGNVVWTREFGTTVTDMANGISVDASGVYVAGYTGGTLPGRTSSGGLDAFARKYDFAGNELWTYQFGTAADDTAWGICIDASRVYVAGITTGTSPGQTSSGGFDAFIMKLVK